MHLRSSYRFLSCASTAVPLLTLPRLLSYSKVRVELSTHDCNGLSRRDTGASNISTKPPAHLSTLPCRHGGLHGQFGCENQQWCMKTDNANTKDIGVCLCVCVRACVCLFVCVRACVSVCVHPRFNPSSSHHILRQRITRPSAVRPKLARMEIHGACRHTHNVRPVVHRRYVSHHGSSYQCCEGTSISSACKQSRPQHTAVVVVFGDEACGKHWGVSDV